ISVAVMGMCGPLACSSRPRKGSTPGRGGPSAHGFRPRTLLSPCGERGIVWAFRAVSEAGPDQLIGGHGGEEKDEVGDRVAEQAHCLARGRGAGQVEGYPQEQGPEDERRRD